MSSSTSFSVPSNQHLALAGSGRRVWLRLQPGANAWCRVSCRGLGAGVAGRQLPVDLSMGGCRLRWTGEAPALGVEGTVELDLPLGTVLLRAVSVYVVAGEDDDGQVGLRFLPGADAELGMVALGSFLLSLVEEGAGEGGNPVGSKVA